MRCLPPHGLTQVIQKKCSTSVLNSSHPERWVKSPGITLRCSKVTLTEEVAKLKAQDGGEIQVHGSGNLIQTLLQHDLVDILRIWQFPVVLGTGKRLFGEGTIPGSFRLVDTQLNTMGAVLHVYERVGGLKYGEVEVGQETVIFDSDIADQERITSS